MTFLKKHWIHFLALALFFFVTYIYFQPQFHGHRLKQHDITQFKGMANETNHFRAVEGEEPLWTNAMFGGMPTYQISVDYHGNLVKKSIAFLRLGLSSPAGLFLIYLIGFYIMLMCMRVDPVVAIFGAFAFAFSSYFIIILQAGHNTKAMAIGLMAPVIGAFYMAYKHNLKWGILLSALFMGMQLGANHFQITYYLGMILLAMGVAELINAIKAKNYKIFGMATVGLLVAYGFALSLNYGNITLTNDYAKHTIRGGNDITITPDGQPNEATRTSGLDRDYITQWSYGVDESFTLISPYIKGGGSGRLKDSPFATDLKSPELRKKAKIVGDNDVYWGDQPFTSGPVYVGIIVFFLAILGLVYLKGPLRFALLVVAVIALMLSWGKNYMGFTDFFLDYIPGYNKFRAVTIILAVVELILPLLGVLFLHHLLKNKERIKENLKPLYITSGAFFGFVLLLTFTGIGDGYLKNQELEYVYNYEEEVRAQLMQEDPQQLLQQYGIDVTNEAQVKEVIQRQSEVVNDQFETLAEVRKGIYRSSMMRSLLFLALGIGLIFVFVFVKVNKIVFIGGLLVLTLADLVMVNLNFLNNEKQGRGYVHWVEDEKFEYPLSPTGADLEILRREREADPELAKTLSEAEQTINKSGKTRASSNEKWSNLFQTLNFETNYRVFEPSAGFNSSRASYFHKSLGGYHGAKLRRIQNLYEFHITKNNMDVLNMMNVKYILQGEQVQYNPSALGNVWFVQDIIEKETPNDELLALGRSFSIVVEDPSISLTVNNKPVTSAMSVTGGEQVKLVNGELGEKILAIAPIIRSGVDASYVVDVNGETDWIPSKELIKDTLDSFKTLVRVNADHVFNPRQMAVVSSEVAQSIGTNTFSGEGNIVQTHYRPNRMLYEVDTKESQLAVFSEVYYPDGWKVYVDGELLPIHRVNYLLRGVALPAGSYTLEMKFDEPRFTTSNTVAYAGSALLFLLILGAFLKDFVLQKREE